MKQSVVRELTTEELVERIEQETEALDKMKIAHSVSQLENPMVFKEKRRGIARLKTELHNREINA